MLKVHYDVIADFEKPDLPANCFLSISFSPLDIALLTDALETFKDRVQSLKFKISSKKAQSEHR